MTNRKKSFKIAFFVLLPLALVALAVALATPFLLPKIFKDKPVTDTIDKSHLTSSYLPRLEGVNGNPILPAELDSIFYSIDPKTGKVDYFDYKDGVLAPYGGEVKSLSKTVTCSNRKLTTTIYYISSEQGLCGYGLFTPTLGEGKRDIYTYALFKLRSLPQAYGKSGALLLVSFEEKDFWMGDRLYSEAFVVSLDPSDSGAKLLTTDNGRTVGTGGALRDDWLLLTDSFLSSLGDKAYFLSGRDYTLDKRGLVTDILLVGSPKPPRAVRGIIGLWALADKDDLYYLKKTPSGFDLIKKHGEEENILKSFEGSYENDYLHSGNFLLNKKSLTLTDLLTGRDRQLEDLDTKGLAFLSVNKEGTCLLLAWPGGQEDRALQRMVYYDLSFNTKIIYEEAGLFSASNPNFTWLGERVFFHLRPSTEGGILAYCFYELGEPEA